ncbi:hypothetical protein [Streptomyces sedi]|uniref:Toxin-antitoxin system HicB family antitoxin n=1 Tax=Streptomyces sedi TaxID=555059 RepID=A0A5C4UZC4_9ACTN|nr:hypothetical protein [Streptomyces sedi]TNM29120.1 hypothetical protein FH715_16365 [Streptomyces sedi]
MTEPSEGRGHRAARDTRKQVLLRLDPAVHEALRRWAADELRSTNAQLDYLIRRALREAGRLPSGARPPARRGRPPAAGAEGEAPDAPERDGE